MTIDRPRRCLDEREDVYSGERWDGGDGLVTFNYLQQREPDLTEKPETPLEAAGGTDAWGISE